MSYVIDKRTHADVDFDAAVARMDPDLKTYLVALNVAEDRQEFYNQYCRMHREAFGTEF
jgi:hypothetical protein